MEMLDIVTPRSIWGMVGLLVDQAPDRLLSDYAKLITNFHAHTMDDDIILSILGGSAAGPRSDVGRGDNESTKGTSTEYKKVPVNPFTNALQQMEAPTGESSDSGGGGNAYANSGQPMVSRRSTFQKTAGGLTESDRSTGLMML